MKKILLLIVSGLLIACMAGSAMADPFTPELYTQSGDPVGAYIDLKPGETTYVRLGGTQFAYLGVDFTYKVDVTGAAKGGSESDVTIIPPSNPFHPTGNGYIDDQLVEIKLAANAPVGAIYSIEVGAEYKGEGTFVDRGIASRGVSSIPEFPTVALPVAAILGLVFIFGRKKEEL